MIDVRALEFIGGVFFDYELPKNKMFLLKYFRTKIESTFLRYYYWQGNIEGFTDRTGWYCQRRWCYKLIKRHNIILAARDEARKNMDMTLLARIEQGRCGMDEFGIK